MKTFSKCATALVLCCVICSAEAQTDSKQNVEQPQTWFTVTPVAERVWRIDDHGSDNMYLVEGTEKALLIDTGTGVADLKGCVQSITKLPLLVVNTHGHPDHAGSNPQFDQVYAHPGDLEMTLHFTDAAYHNEQIKRIVTESPGLESLLLKEIGDFTADQIIPVKDGHVFDLGGRTLEVIETPGHTDGSICLFDSTNKLLFTGDNNNTIVWLFLDGCLPVEGYLQTLEKLQKKAGEIQIILPGHGGTLDGAFIGEQIVCARNILSGACKGEPYHSFAGDALLCTYERAGIAFRADHLHIKE